MWSLTTLRTEAADRADKISGHQTTEITIDFAAGLYKTGEDMRKNNAVETSSDNILDFGPTLGKLSKTVTPDLVRRRETRSGPDGNVQTVEYVEWHTVADILDESAPNWEHSVKDIKQIGDLVTVIVAISIGGITREGIGTGSARTEMGIKKAEHDALKRAAVKFGIARELYKREFESGEDRQSSSLAAERNDSAENSFPSDPVAASLSDLVTAKQLGMIRAIGRESGVDPEAECNLLMKCSVAELSKRAASSLIDHLQKAQQHPAAAMPLRRAG